MSSDGIMAIGVILGGVPSSLAQAVANLHDLAPVPARSIIYLNPELVSHSEMQGRWVCAVIFLVDGMPVSRSVSARLGRRVGEINGRNGDSKFLFRYRQTLAITSSTE